MCIILGIWTMACPARDPEERRRKLVVIWSLTEWRSWETGNVSQLCRLLSVELCSDILTSFFTTINFQFPLLWTSCFLVCRKENWTRWSLMPLLFRWFYLEVDRCFIIFWCVFFINNEVKLIEWRGNDLYILLSVTHLHSSLIFIIQILPKQH